MKKNILSLLFILIFVGYSAKASAQDSLKTQLKNTIYASGTLGWWFVASASYERRLFSTDNKFYANYYLRASYGGGNSWNTKSSIEGPYGSLSLQGVFGPKKSHLELGLGFAALYDIDGYGIEVRSANLSNSSEPSRSDFTIWAPAISVGYRYQKPTGGFIFRTGMSYPDGVYLSFGFAF